MSRRKQANPKPIKVLDEVSEETEATGDVTNMIVTSDGEYLEQECDGYEDDLCPLVIDTAAISPAEKKKYELPDSMDHSEVHEQLPDLDINEQNSYSPGCLTTEPNSQSNTLVSSMGTSSKPDVSLSWDGATICPSSITKNKNGGRLISPSKTRRKSDKIQPLTNHTGEEEYACPICKHVVMNSHELTRHIRSHNSAAAVTVANTCTICGKALSSQSSLDRHMLVHSGERPFQCHFCAMSFTTNGNMHRHMRIHEKDGTSTEPIHAPIPPTRTRTKHKITHDDINPDLLAPLTGAHPEKKKCSGLGDATAVVATKINTSAVLPSAEATGVVAMAAVQVKQEPLDLQWDTVAMPVFATEYEATSDSERVDEGSHLTYENQLEPVASSTYQKLLEISPMKNFEDLASQKPGVMVPCPVCNKTFFSAYGIEAHLHGNHPNYMVQCPTCGIKFKSHIAQQRHQLQKHSPWLSKLADCNKSSVPIGFHQLSFASFSCAQFPLIAKAWCERHQRCTSSDTHSFTCQRCYHAFPCYEALQMHMETHAPEVPSTCLQCDCNFATLAAYDDHMTLHSCKKVMAGYTQMDGGDDNLVQDAVSKDEFLLMLNLKSNSVSSHSCQVAADAKNDAKKNGLEPIIGGLPVKLESASSGQLISRFHDLMMQPKDVTKLPDNDTKKFAMGAVAMASTSGLRSITMANGSGCAPQMKTIDDMLERDRKDGGGVLTCNCCDETFTNIRAYKGHVRAHLGLSPYKCDQCSYSSADKSTLVRHLRTHNGERPFQCLICEFAFTTKANCERHVRKKHDCRSKEEFEQAIGYNRYMMESPLDIKTFQSPNTVCKYCGEDFKFFRALKHHLRSHSSCQHKPFICRLCYNGFSTKANCVRHVQKQHVDIDAVQVDQCIHVNQNLPSRIVSRQEAALVCDKDDTHSESSMSPLPGRPLISQALMKPSPLFGGSSVCVMTPPIVMSDMLSEDGDADEPLDFSMKASSTDDMNSRDASYSDSVVSGESQNQPIDLTLHARPESSSRPATKSPNGNNNSRSHPRTSSILAKHVSSLQLAGIPQTLTTEPPAGLPMYLPYHSVPMLVAPRDYGVLRYKKEYQKYFNPIVSQLECPFCSMLFRHGLKLMVHMRSHTNERPFNCPLCNIGFTIKTNLDRHLKTKHPGSFPKRDLPHPEDTSSWDTSVNAVTDDDDDGDDVMIVSEANNNVPKLTNGRLPVQSPNNSYGSDCDLSSVNRILDATDGTKFQALLCLAPGDRQLTSTECDDDSYQGRAFQSTPEPASFKVTPGVLADSSVDGVTAAGEDDQPQAKKKRNSYADSPHKLQCPYCPRAFPWISSLKRHLLTHTGQKPFKCPQCPVTFSTKSNRERHMVRKHGLDIHDPATRQMMDRPYKCHLCVFSSFSTASNLLKHYREKHESAEIPDDLVDTANNGAMHTSALSGGNTDQVAALCQSIDSQDNMSSVSEMSESRQSAGLEFEDEEEEMETDVMEEGLGKKLQELTSVSPAPTPPPGGTTVQTPPQSDNYNVDSVKECWHCAARFPTRRALLHHMKEHGGANDLPFKCYLCDASYDARRQTLEHMMAMHPKDWAVLHQKNNLGSDISGFLAEMCCAVTEIESEADKNGAGSDSRTVESDYSQRKVHCALCPKRFWSLQDLRRHMRSHTGERPFRCDLCEKTFTLKHSMLRHRTRHTKTCDSVSDEEGATSSAVKKNLNAIATMNGHIRLLEPKRRGVKLATNTRTMGSVVQHKLVKERPSSSLTPTALGHQMVDVDDTSNDSDMLQNLLGVENSAIDQMLNSADSAAHLLGVD